MVDPRAALPLRVMARVRFTKGRSASFDDRASNPAGFVGSTMGCIWASSPSGGVISGGLASVHCSIMCKRQLLPLAHIRSMDIIRVPPEVFDRECGCSVAGNSRVIARQDDAGM